MNTQIQIEIKNSNKFSKIKNPQKNPKNDINAQKKLLYVYFEKNVGTIFWFTTDKIRFWLKKWGSFWVFGLCLVVQNLILGMKER